MEHSSIPSAQILVEHCKTYGIENIVISPGSRNAPLTLSFTEDSFFTCYSIVDERCAAFFALGIAQQIRRPVIAVCTSGSALLNYYPAVAEAFYSDIPLVIISADRPSYKIDIGDGQTIRQDNVFDRHIGYAANLLQDVSHATNRLERYAPELLGKGRLQDAQAKVEDTNHNEIVHALDFASFENGPVHINIPFEEPLYDMVPKDEVSTERLAKKNGATEVSDYNDFVAIWNDTQRKMVLVGSNPPNELEQKHLDLLAQDPSVILMTETTSNLHHQSFFTSIDSIIAPIEKAVNKEELFEALRPDILLTFGGLIVSKKIKAFLREYKPKHHWHIDPKKANNTFFRLTHHFERNPNTFLKSFLSNTKEISSDYFSFWYSRRKKYELKREEYFEKIPFSDMLAFEGIFKNIPENYQLQLANSSTVRYAQLFDLKASLQVFCNRGTSGIDGSVSTAVGASIYYESPTILITGDLSFLYDSNGLWNNYIRPDFRIIVINNDGGGIFRILPGHRESENFRTFFETPQSLKLSNLSEMYGFEFTSVCDMVSLNKTMKFFYESSERPKLLEIKTPQKVNNQILLNYFDFIS